MHDILRKKREREKAAKPARENPYRKAFRAKKCREKTLCA